MEIEPPPLGAAIERYRQQAQDLAEAYRAGDATARDLVRNECPELDGSAVALADAQEVVARRYAFDSWETLAAWADAVGRAESRVARFESAAEAIVSGDAATLTRLLREDAELVHERSMRSHRATLLIYVGANGVEGYRQKTPPNAVQIAEILLDAGSEIAAVGTMYRGTTTLGLVATSVHPVITGVQEELMQLLLDRGASTEGAVAPDYTDGLVVNACLANGRPSAALFLAQRGATLNLEGAAGVGRLDSVKSYFDEDGNLKASATDEHLKSAFKWACGYGRTNVVEFLLTKGIDVSERHRGETRLHVAALGGHLDVVDMLLQRGAPIDAKDETYKSTPLGWALWGWSHPAPDWKDARHYEVVRRLVAAGSKIEPAWLDDENLRSDPRMLAALTTTASEAT
ncbi:MAG: ankyrin repeat domain-containing protein [Gemmatimonadaceae bacterium]